MRAGIPVLLVVLAGAAACGPIQASTAINKAEEELRTARLAEAERDAPYEYTKAMLYIDMAKERQGFSDFEISKTLADEAQRLAIAAKENGPRNARMREIRKNAPKPPAPATSPAVVPAPALVPGTGGAR